MNMTEQMNRKELTEARTSNRKVFENQDHSNLYKQPDKSSTVVAEAPKGTHLSASFCFTKMDTSGIKSQMQQENRDISHSSIQYPIWEAAMEVTWEQ